MAKIKFTLDAWLKDKSQKVETRDGCIVHNIWPVKDPLLVNGKRAEVCALIDGEEDALVFFEGGKYCPATIENDNPFDLFIVTPKEEMSEWQRFISVCLQKHGLLDCGAADRIAKESAAELLALAREELFANDTVLKEYAQASREQGKAEAVEKFKQSWFNEGKIAGRFEGLTEDEKYQQGVHDGKEEALKEFPRWKKCQENDPNACVYNCVAREDSLLYYDGHTLRLIDLEKLLGFKED